ncbi:MAG: phosphonate ABC transporter ATP-binding protein [FCB group bacterium]|nr:phosphonate ABC transporter ATP-binding protein [FCB group bacterium]MBL7029509.1 phosphonate ABC transporter ATP-binding protein [Candidatus Neomarinimicrobiota bacterium]MBL7122952.1 phosphonate ABC transporter ATP-binding protein [Candidatus Neomarinimicrobiota bacterium]
MVEFVNISKTFPDGTAAVHNVSITAPEKEFSVILGPSGAGKTTLLRTVNRLVRPSSGKVLVNGTEITDANQRQIRSDVGMIFQQFNLVGNLSVLINVLSGCLGTHQKWWSTLYLFPKVYRLKALDLLDRVGLLDQAYKRADELSGGQQQRVGIARALMQEPRVLLADEPVASVDPRTSQEILKLLKDLCKEKNLTVLCTLHQVDLALQFSDRIIGIADGEIILNEKSSKLDVEKLKTIYSSKNHGLFFGPTTESANDPQNINWNQ